MKKNNESKKVNFIYEIENRSIIFVDLVGFSKTNGHDKSIEILKDFVASVNAITTHLGGRIEKIIGDEVLITFKDKSSQNSANMAFECAFSIYKHCGFHVRVGLNFGGVHEISVDKKHNNEIFGQSINITKRTISINKIYNTEFMMTERIFSLLRDKRKNECYCIDNVKLRGFKHPFNIYTIKLGSDLSDFTNNWTSPRFDNCEPKLINRSETLLKLYARGLDLYLKGNWSAAYRYFIKARKECNNDGPCNRLIDRIEKINGWNVTVMFLEAKKKEKPNYQSHHWLIRLLTKIRKNSILSRIEQLIFETVIDFVKLQIRLLSIRDEIRPPNKWIKNRGNLGYWDTEHQRVK